MTYTSQEAMRERMREFVARGWTVGGGSWLSARGMVATVQSRLTSDSPQLLPVTSGGYPVGVAEVASLSADRLGVLVYWDLHVARVGDLIERLRQQGPGPDTVRLVTTEHSITSVVITPGGWRDYVPQDAPKVQTSMVKAGPQ